MNPNQKKFIWIAGIALAVVYFAPSFINSSRRAALIREQYAAHQVKPPAGKSASPLPAPGAAPGLAGTSPEASSASNPPTPFDTLPGVWQGVAYMPDRG